LAGFGSFLEGSASHQLIHGVTAARSKGMAFCMPPPTRTSPLREFAIPSFAEMLGLDPHWENLTENM